MTSVRDVSPLVRGIGARSTLRTLAARLTQRIARGEQKPFEKVIDLSLCDPRGAGMAPITFVRQVLAACVYPELLQDACLPVDARLRAQKLLACCSGRSVGSYTLTSCGQPRVHEGVAEFIGRRDGGGVGSQPGNIILSSGSQKALSLVLHLMASGEGPTRAGVLTPAPCPHTLPMLLEVSGVASVPYQLAEDRGWAVDVAELRRAVEAGRGRCQPRAIYVSNPGNPTGHVQDRESIESVIRFAAAERLVLLADEIHQDSVFGPDREFISYKKVLFEMGGEFSQTVELVSVHSLSSACMGEAGLRGAYMEVVNLDPGVHKHLRESQSGSSPAILPQLALEVLLNPPTPGDPSYPTFAQEILHIQTTLAQNAWRACKFLNDLPGMSCQPAMGGVFLYPRLRLPPAMVEEAEMSGVEADELYCRRLLEEEGVCLGAGCENRQGGENLHVRLCILAPPTTLEDILARLRSFHLRLLGRSP